MSNYTWPASMPYDSINIYDQTEYSESTRDIDTVTIPSGPIAYIPFISPKGYGNDNELVFLNSSSINRYGNPNFHKYGLSLYLANQFIAGGGNIVGMRLKDVNARHSHVGIVANVKLVVDEPMVEEDVDSNDIPIYYPYFKRADSSISEDPRYFTGITYTYATEEIDNEGVSHTIDEKISFVDGAKITVNGREVLLSDIYTIDKLTLKDKTTGTVIYTMIKKQVIKSSIDPVYFNTVGEAGDKDRLQTAFSKYVSKNEDGTFNKAFPATFGNNITDTNGNVTGTVGLTPGETYTIPLFLLYSLPSGANNYSVSISYDNTMESYSKNVGDSERFYKMSTYDGSTEIEKKISFTLAEYVYQDQSMNIDDVVQDYLTNVGYIPGNLDDMYAILDKYVTNGDLIPNDGTDHFGVDILFGGNKETNNVEYDTYNNYIVESSCLTSPISFMGGSLGDFESNDETVKNAAIVNALVNAYDGTITDFVFDEVRYPFEIIFQASDDTAVCKAMYSLVDARDSTVASMYTLSNCKTYSESRSNRLKTYYDDFMTSKMFYHVESAIIRDPYTHKRIRMPSTYFNAMAIPRLITTYGYGAPLAGPKFYWDGFVINTMLPKTTAAQQYIENHNVQINTMCEDGTGKAFAIEQITTQQKTSALSEINNSIALRKMCYLAYKQASLNRWSTLDDDEIGVFKTNLETAIQGELSNAYQSLNITAERESVNGAGRNRIYCRIEVSFNSMLKGVTYGIYIV